MSKILAYNNKTTGESWIPLSGQYSADEIEMIADSNGGLSQTPRTAIPSPFAQMDLVKNAFHRLSTHTDLHGETMDEKLVSDALDIAQLFFCYKELTESLHIVTWNRATEIAKLLTSPQHRIVGETIEMFLKQDQEAFNFAKMDKLHFLVYGNAVIGSTSPVTLFMASPNAAPDMYDIPLEQNVKIFSRWRPLYQREKRFVVYCYALFTAYPELKQLCSEVNAYLIRNFRLLPQDTQSDITKNIGNPEALDMDKTDKALNYLNANFDKMEDGVQALGVPFYCARQQDIEEDIAASDFRIQSTKATMGEKMPLVLQNHLNAPANDPFRYIVDNWDDSIVITPEDYAHSPEKRLLPGTTHQYPWLTDDDFLEPALIKLDYAINRDCFFDGNITQETRETDDNDFLLPIKPLFFKYFNVSDLWGTIGGRPRFELRHSKTGQTETVKAILRIPVQKSGHYVTLSRTYIQSTDCNLTYDNGRNCGKFITIPFAIAIFPFVKTTQPGQYHIQLVDRALGQMENYAIGLTFHDSAHDEQTECTARKRSMKAVKRVGSLYYRLDGSFDHIKASLTDDLNRVVAEGIICPRWANHVEGHEAFTFAVDFGTTNTHVECMRENQMPAPLKVASATQERMVATLYNGSSILYDVILHQEFLPQVIGGEYGFPQRTVLSESEHLNAAQADEIIALCDADIPFIYEKESIGYGNRIIADLKWSTDLSTNKRIHTYLTELAQLMRTKVLLENGDLAKTRVVWFYPLSMKVGRIRKMEEMWEKTFEKVFGTTADEKNLLQMPESVAPYYYYKCSSQFRGAAANVASIDIGGGSSDVAVFESNTGVPTLLTSFRFAANTLFGDGFSELPHGDTNPLTRKYVGFFRQIFDRDDDKYGELNGIMDDIVDKRKSEDINAFLFSIENNKATKGNDLFSFNKRLNEDETRKIIFIYFYAAIIYYVARMMEHRQLDMPQSIMFSGTGSKTLDIVGTKTDLELLTRHIFEKVYAKTYGEKPFSIVTERTEPKHITCRGALLQVRDETGCKNVQELNRQMYEFDNPLKYNYSMLDKETLTYDDMSNSDIQASIVNEVRKYNTIFLQLCEEAHVCDRFLVSRKAFELFKTLLNKDLEHHLITGWNFYNKNQSEKNGSDPIEDAVFFYPIIGSIRDNMIENLKEE